MTDVLVTLSHDLKIDLSQISHECLKAIQTEFTFKNQEYVKLRQMGYPTQEPPFYETFHVTQQSLLTVWRGGAKKVARILKDHGYTVVWDDKRLTLGDAGYKKGDLKLRDYQEGGAHALLKAQQGILRGKTGSGKCLGEGTLVLKMDATLEAVENLKVGDVLIGPDSQPRTITSTTIGYDQLYSVKSEHDSLWVCNGDHILTLFDVRTLKLTDMTVVDFLSLPKEKKKQYRQRRTPVTWPNADVSLDPYEAGVRYAFESRMHSESKAIENQYLKNSYRVRSLFLAGFLDDHAKVRKSGFFFISTDVKTVKSISLLCQTLGYRVSTRYALEYCDSTNMLIQKQLVWITGATYSVPTRKERPAPTKDFKHHLNSYIHVSDYTMGKYYGFTLKEEPHFLLGDTTITHNTETLIGAIVAANEPALVIVWNKDLQKQWVERLLKYGILEESQIGGVGGIFQGRKKGRITVAMQQSLVRSIPSFLDDFGTVVMDECVHGDTLVTLHDWSKRKISEIHDDHSVTHVMAWDSEYKMFRPAKINHRFRNKKNRHWYRVKVKTGPAANRELICTPDHKIWTSRGYTEAKDLVFWQSVKSVRHKKEKEARLFSSTLTLEQPSYSYDLEVDRFHNYVANDILISNCQRAPANTFIKTVTAFPAKYKWGASADERRTDGKEYLAYSAFGGVVHEMDSGAKVLTPKIYIVPTRFSDLKYQNDRNYSRLINRLVADRARNKLISYFLKGELLANRQIILFTERVQQALEWVEVVRNWGVDAGPLIGGDIMQSETSATLRLLKKGVVRFAAATTYADVGLDVPSLDCAFITCPTAGNERRMGQQVGRVLRPHEGKENALVYYFWDQHCVGIDKKITQLKRSWKDCWEMVEPPK